MRILFRKEIEAVIKMKSFNLFPVEQEGLTIFSNRLRRMLTAIPNTVLEAFMVLSC